MQKLNKNGLIVKRIVSNKVNIGNVIFDDGTETPGALTQNQINLLSHVANAEGRPIFINDDGSFDTKVGHTYAVSGVPPFTVSNIHGDILKRSTNNSQIVFVANTSKSFVSNRECSVVEVFRGAALSELDWSGTDDRLLPFGYYPLSFLESTGWQYIIFPDAIVNSQIGVYMRAQGKTLTSNRFNFPLSWQRTTNYRTFRIDNRTPSSIFWWHEGSSSVTSNDIKLNDGEFEAYLNWENNDSLELTDCYGTKLSAKATNKSLIPELKGFSLFGGWDFDDGGKFVNGLALSLNEFAVTSGTEQVLHLLPALDGTGAPCLVDTLSQQAYYNMGSVPFIAGMTLEQVRGLRLPSTGGELTISLPLEASADIFAQNALKRAQNNGWLLTLQYIDNELPSGYTRLKYLETTGPQYIVCDVLVDANFGLIYDVERWQETTNGFMLDWQGPSGKLMRIANGWSLSDVSKTDQVIWWGQQCGSGALTARQKWQVNWKNNKQVVFDAEDTHKEFALNGVMEANYPKAVFGKSITWDSSLSNFSTQFSACLRWWSIKMSSGETLAYDLVPALDSSGHPCMFDIVNRKALYNSGNGEFAVGMTLEQVCALQLPAGGGSLTLGLPYEASTNEFAQAALERARANGWELTIQYSRGLQPVAFLESNSGLQYINTGYIPDNETGILLEQEKIAIGDAVPMGCRNSNSTETRFYAFRTQAAKPGEERAGYGWEQWFYSTTSTAKQTTKLNYLNSRAAASDNSSTELSTLSFVPEQPIYMFAANIGGTAALHWTGRIYSSDISQGTVVVREFIPAVDESGIPCVWEKRENKCYYNRGEGDFIVGLATVEEVLSFVLPSRVGSLTISVPSETTEDDIAQLHTNNPTWTLTIQIR